MRDLVLVLAVTLTHACVPVALTGGTQGEAPAACDAVDGCDYMGGNDESVVVPLVLLAAVAGTPLLVRALWRLHRRTPPPRALIAKPT